VQTRTSSVSNRIFAERDLLFQQSCRFANVPPTKRQASKYRAGKGLAFEVKPILQQARRIVADKPPEVDLAEFLYTKIFHLAPEDSDRLAAAVAENGAGT
jgi:hypothetical protein